MNDDIVTRLRGSWDCSCLYIKEHGLEQKCLDCEAADEIERLRALVEHLAAQVRLQMKANDKAWEAYKEVVGDD